MIILNHTDTHNEKLKTKLSLIRTFEANIDHDHGKLYLPVLTSQQAPQPIPIRMFYWHKPMDCLWHASVANAAFNDNLSMTRSQFCLSYFVNDVCDTFRISVLDFTKMRQRKLDSMCNWLLLLFLTNEELPMQHMNKQYIVSKNAQHDVNYNFQ